MSAYVVVGMGIQGVKRHAIMSTHQLIVDPVLGVTFVDSQMFHLTHTKRSCFACPMIKARAH